MGKRHNRKRTRSRPRHRDASNTHQSHHRFLSTDGLPMTSNPHAHPVYLPFMDSPKTETTWQQSNIVQNQLRILRYQQDREKALEMQRLRFFGGYSNDEVSLFEPMLKVVTDLFDGNTDYEDP